MTRLWLSWLLYALLVGEAAAQDLERRVTFVTDPPGAQVYLEVSGRQRYEKYLGLSGQELVLDLRSLRGASHYRVTLRLRDYYDRTETVPLYYSGLWPAEGRLVLEPRGWIPRLRRQWAWIAALVGLACGTLGVLARRRPPGTSAETVGGWTVEEEIGQGGLARVYRARSPAGESAALKVIRADGDPETLERFRREVLAWRRLQHAHIVPLYDYGEEGGRLYLAMEWMSGGTLRGRIVPGGLPCEQALALLLPLMSAVEHAHAAGVLHRDLKPENVLLSAEGSPKLADFGLARPLEVDTITRTGTVLGTLAYLSPEQLGNPHDPAPCSDQYALGVIAFELLAGRKPFPEREAIQLMLQQLHRAPPPLASLRPDLPAHVTAAVDRMVKRKPEERFPSVGAAREALEGL